MIEGLPISPLIAHPAVGSGEIWDPIYDYGEINKAYLYSRFSASTDNCFLHFNPVMGIYKGLSIKCIVPFIPRSGMHVSQKKVLLSIMSEVMGA